MGGMASSSTSTAAPSEASTPFPITLNVPNTNGPVEHEDLRGLLLSDPSPTQAFKTLHMTMFMEMNAMTTAAYNNARNELANRRYQPNQSIPCMWSSPVLACQTPWGDDGSLSIWTFENEGCIVIQRINKRHFYLPGISSENALVVESDLIAANGAHWSMSSHETIHEDLWSRCLTMEDIVDRTCALALGSDRRTCTWGDAAKCMPPPEWKPASRVLAISFERILSLQRKIPLDISKSKSSSRGRLSLQGDPSLLTTNTWFRARQLWLVVSTHIQHVPMANEVLRYAGMDASTTDTVRRDDGDGSPFPGQVQLHDIYMCRVYDRYLRQQKCWMDCQEAAIAELGRTWPRMSFLSLFSVG